MQIFYVAMTVSAMLTVGLFNQQDNWTDSVSKPKVVSEQMSLWHQKTYEKCVADGCSNGSVNPEGYVSTVLEFENDDGTEKFVSMYDESTRTLETRLNSDTDMAGNLSSNPAFSARVETEPYRAVRLDQQMARNSDQRDDRMEGNGDENGLYQSYRLHPEPFSTAPVGPVIVSVLPN